MGEKGGGQMNARELERLLGGFAAGTLTGSERGELMRAALEDQQLFDALADEEALRDALADPVFRSRLRARLAPVEVMDEELLAAARMAPALPRPAMAMSREAAAAPPTPLPAPEKNRNLRWMWWLAPALAAGLALIFVVGRHEEKKPVEMAAVHQMKTQAEAPAPAAPPVAKPTAAPVQPKPAAQPPAKATQEELRAPPPADVRQMAEAPKTELSALASAPAEKKTVRDEPDKAEAQLDAAAGAALELQVEREVAGRFEAVELGALKKGDRVRFRVRPPEAGRLTMVVGRAVAQSISVQPGRTYYLPEAAGMAPGDEPVEVAIAVAPVTGNLFRSRSQAQSQTGGGVVGGAAPAAPAPAAAAREAAREAAQDAAKSSMPAGREVRLRLEFKPR